jgi:peptide/nickel transport system substrate-binding protein
MRVGERSKRFRPASLLIVAVLAMAAVAVAFTGSARGTDLRPGLRQGVEPDVMNIGFTQEPDSLNPFAGVLSASYFMYTHVYDLLVGFGKDLEPVPQLASDWSVADDDVTWTFNLFDDVTWHDGEPFTADDVKFTIDYIQQCELSLFIGYLGNPATDPVYIASVTVTSPTQVVITTNTPKANMLAMYVFIFPQHIWEGISCQQAERVANNPPIGTGPYKFTEWVQGTGGYLRMDRHTDYHLAQDVLAQDPDFDFVDQIYMLFYADSLPLYQDFLAGALDATDSLTTRQFTEMDVNLPSDPDPDPDVGKFVYPTIGLSEIGFCVATDQVIEDFALPPPQGKRHWLMTNLTVRQAIAMAIDRQSLIDNAYQGLGDKGESLLPPANPFWHYDVPDADEYIYDLTAAADLLSDPKGDGWTLVGGATSPGMFGENLDPAAANNADAFADIDADGVREVIDPTQVYDDVDQDGVTDAAPKGNEGLGTSASELRFGVWIIDYATEQQTSADIYIPWLAQIGIAVQKVIVGEGAMISVSYACDYDLYMWGWGGDVDPDFLLSVMTTGQILGWQDAWYSNPEYDAMYLQQQGLVDLFERQAVIFEMQRILYAHQPYIVYMYPYGTTAVRIDRFTGWGNWIEDPGLGLSGFGNAFLMLQLQPIEGAANTCPTKPTLSGPTTVFVDDSATFAANSIDPEGDALTFTFDWDDGSTSVVTPGAGVSDATASHAWAATGSYDVLITVSDGLCGLSVTSDILQVTVETPPEETGWLAGTVTDASTGDPLQGALVSVGAQSEATAPDGTYNLTLAPGAYTVTVSRNLYVTQTRSTTVVVDATTTEDFDLVPNRGWIAGTVTDAGTGAALNGALVEVVSAAGGVTPTTANAQGAYNVTLAPGTYTVNASSTGYAKATRTGVAVQLGEATTVDFALTRFVAAGGIDPLVAGGIALVVIAAIAVTALLVLRRRKKQEEMPMPPPPEPPKP